MCRFDRKNFLLLIHCGGLRCKSMMCGKRLLLQLCVVVFFFFFLLFLVLTFLPDGGVNTLVFFCVCVRVCECTASTLYSDKTRLCSLIKSQC